MPASQCSRHPYSPETVGISLDDRKKGSAASSGLDRTRIGEEIPQVDDDPSAIGRYPR
jgi:hypothetical protein